jgi:putative colanic acid biosynthesis acetyltransferase WcaF
MEFFRVLLLRLFGARVKLLATISRACRIYAPYAIVLGEMSCLAAGVDCHCVDGIVLEDDVTVSPDAFLCTASHDID